MRLTRRTVQLARACCGLRDAVEQARAGGNCSARMLLRVQDTWTRGSILSVPSGRRVEVFEPQLAEWIKLTSVRQVRLKHSCTPIGDKLVFAGGRDSDNR